jgi:ABC-type Zn uptake system ZnuABC Zn-binding protein ZnuA
MRIRSRKGRHRFLASCLVLALLGGAAARPNVVVSIHPLFDLVRQIAGDDADVVRVLAPGASPHTFDPTPRDVARIVAADLVVMNGGLDLWLRNLVEASGARAPVLELIGLEAVRAVLAESFPDLVAREAGDAGGAVYGFNAHVWLDPLVMAAAVPELARALADADGAAAGRYLARAAALVADLEALHEELATGLALLAGAAFVPFHDAWPYFAARYGLDLVVEIEPFPGREPSPAYLRSALAQIRESGARVVFGEAQLERRPAEVVADEAGVALAILDPLGGLPERESYQELLRWNAAVLLESLR